MKKQTLSITLPDGKIETRKTSHDYRFVVAARFDGSKKSDNPHWDGWTAMNWTTRIDLAQKQKSKLESENWKKAAGLVETKILTIE